MTNRFDSKNYVPVQELSVDFVDPRKNPIACVSKDPSKESDPLLFDFKAEHNGVQCIESLRPEDKGTERQFWFTRQMLSDVFECGIDTIRRRVEALVNTGDLDVTQNCVTSPVPNSLGAMHDTSLYDLTVFNKLAMTLIDNPRAVEMRKAFNDVLVKHETQAPLTIYDYARALLAEKERSDALEAQNKALQAERDEAVRTKYHFVAGRDAKVCGELGGLRTQNEALRKQIGDSKTYKAVTAITWLPDYFDLSNKGLYGSLAHKLKKLEAEMPPEFAHIDIPDPRYGKVKAYHVGVIERLHEMVQGDESLMEKYRKVSSL